MQKQTIIATFLGIIALMTITQSPVLASENKVNESLSKTIIEHDSIKFEESYPVLGINKNFRERNSLVVFTSDHNKKTTETIGIGYETIVENGKVVATTFGANSKIPTNLTMEDDNSFVISGRGIGNNEAGRWLLRNAKPGTEIQLNLSEANNMTLTAFNIDDSPNPEEPPNPENLPTDPETPADTTPEGLPNAPGSENNTNTPSPEINQPETTPVGNPGTVDNSNENNSSHSPSLPPLETSPGETVQISLNVDRRGETVSIRIISAQNSFQMFSNVDTDNTVSFTLPNHVSLGMNRLKIEDKDELIVALADVFVTMPENTENSDAQSQITKPDSLLATEGNLEIPLANTGSNNKILFSVSVIFLTFGIVLLVRKSLKTKQTR